MTHVESAGLRILPGHKLFRARTAEKPAFQTWLRCRTGSFREPAISCIVQHYRLREVKLLRTKCEVRKRLARLMTFLEMAASFQFGEGVLHVNG